VHVTVLAALAALVLIAHAGNIALNYPQEWRGEVIPWQLALLHAWGVTAQPGWNAPSWSISAEWFAYLCFPLLAPALTRARESLIALVIALAALGGTALIFAIFDWRLNTWVGAPALTRVFGEFLCGAALCRAVMLGIGQSRGDLVGAAAFALFLVGASVNFPDFGLVALLALTIFGAATARRSLVSALGCRPLLWLGEISYSIYMVHFPALLVLRRFWQHLGFAQWSASGKAVAFAITVLLVVALAAALFYLVEHPARTRLRDQVGKLAPA
jgi:peptidoglycan/LPS O-acetylase OafA/YrhL